MNTADETIAADGYEIGLTGYFRPTVGNQAVPNGRPRLALQIDPVISLQIHREKTGRRVRRTEQLQDIGALSIDAQTAVSYRMNALYLRIILPDDRARSAVKNGNRA